jgi:hypothetical protein
VNDDEDAMPYDRQALRDRMALIDPVGFLPEQERRRRAVASLDEERAVAAYRRRNGIVVVDSDDDHAEVKRRTGRYSVSRTRTSEREMRERVGKSPSDKRSERRRLTDEQVIEIRRLFFRSGLSVEEITAAVGADVSGTVIVNAAAGITYAEVPAPEAAT